jgi:outer membrane biosynthesis protein TonB
MTRLERKCFVASASAHGVFALLLAIGPVIWVTKHPEQVTLPVLTFLPSRLVDGATGGGGNPKITEMPAPAPPAPPQVISLAPPQPAIPNPEPPAEAPAKSEPKPPKAEPKSAKSDAESTPTKPRSKKGGEPIVVDKKSKPDDTDDGAETKPGKKHTIELSFARDKSSSSDGERDSRAKAEANARAAREAQAAFSSRLNSVLGAIGQGMSSGTSVEMPGPGGEAFADYAQFVELFYKRAWSPPTDLADNKAVVRAMVVILHNGTVESFKLVKPSRNAALDESVERLKKLKTVEAFPEGAKEIKRTFYINFILQSER